MKTLRNIASSVAPGLFMVGYVIGTGSVTTMVVAGARYGMSLTWALFLSCLFTAFLMIGISRLTIVSGKTLMYNFRKHIHPVAGILIILSLIITAVASIMGIIAIATSVIQEWTLPIISGGICPVISSLLLIGILFGLYWFGKHETLLKFLTVMVSIMAVCFILTMVMVVPDLTQIANGLVPQIPESGEPHIVIAGMVGTTMAGICLVSRSTVVKEKGWQVKDLKEEQRDSTFAMVLTFFISAAIIASAAGTLHLHGIYVNDATEMIQILEPLAGKFAVSIFAIGILSAAFSSILPNMIILPWLINDYYDKDTPIQNPRYRLMVFIIALSGLIVPLLGGKPVIIMIASQAVSPLVMPLLIGVLFYLLNYKKIMGEYKAGWFLNTAILLTFIFSIFMSYISYQGFLKMITNLF